MFTTLLSEDTFVPANGIDYFEHLSGLIATFSLYLVLALAAMLIVTATLLYYKKRELLKGIKGFALGTVTGVSIGIIGVMTYISIYVAFLKNRLNNNFYLAATLLIFAAVAVTAVAVTALYNKKAAKFLSMALSGAGVIFATVCAFVIFKDKYEVLAGKKALYYILASALAIGLIAFAVLFRRKGAFSDTKAITYAAVCIAVSFALSYIKFFSLSLGGSVTLASLLPLMLYSYMFGVRKGVFAGIIYGILQFFQSPQVYEGVQFFLDYPIAFGFIGVAGIFRNSKLFKANKTAEFIAGAVLAVVLRYLSHVVSGIFVFYSWAVDMPYVRYSFAYNSFAFVDLLIIVAAAIPLFVSKSFCKELERINPLIEG